jgi:DNA-directed RNA polymerase I subunit RPA1
MSPKTRANGNNGLEGEDADEAVPVETVEQFSARIDAAVKEYIDQALMPDEGVADVGSSDSKPDIERRAKPAGRDSYKDGLVYSERRDVLHDFGRKAYMKCSHCNA